MNNSKLYTTPNYNPYFNSKNHKRVEKIKIFKDGEILASVNWFSGSNYSNNRFPEINLPTELREKRKEDLTVNFCFLFNSSIYIPADLVNFREDGEKFDFETDCVINYHNFFSIDIEAVKWLTELNEVGELVWNKSPMQLTTITQSYKYRQVEKPLFIEAGKIQEEVKKHDIDISRYDILKMMKIYNFTKK